MKIWTRLSPNTSNSSPVGHDRKGPAQTEARQGKSRPATATPNGPAATNSASRPLTPRAQSARVGPSGSSQSVVQRMAARSLGPVGARVGKRRSLRDWCAEHPFTMWVIMPTLIIGAYFFGFAAPQYLSESRFTVRAQIPRVAGVTVGGEALGSAGFVTSPENIASVRDYLVSHDAVRKLREAMDLVEIFRRPEADVISRLWWAEPTAERLRSFFRWQVSVRVDVQTGISDLRVWSFRPLDSQELSRRLLTLSEELVNAMNGQIREESMRAARGELRRAETRVTDARVALTVFRQQERAVDPSATASAAVNTISGLETDIARARSDLQTIQGFARPNSPQIMNLQNRIRGLEAQAAEERSRIAGAGTGFTEQIETFARLNAEVSLSQNQLEAATIALDRANGDAARQAIFLLRIVEPNMAERSLFPLPYWATLYAFISLSLLYGLAWLILAGMREHAR